MSRRGWLKIIGAGAIFIGAFSLAASCAGCSVKYVVQAGVGQAKLLMAREPVSKVIEDPNTPPDIKEKLELIAEAKAYGVKEVGLNETESYTSYVELDSDVVSWNLMASPKLELKPVTWWFPVIGRVPYLGYFKKESGLRKEAKLKKEGYDTYMRGAAAYSTLGYFADPIVSSLMKYDKATLANIILHEMTHTTVFIEGHVAYNEGLAQFVGNQSSLDFLTKKFGPDSAEVQAIRDDVYNDKVFSVFLKELYDNLTKLYSSNLSDAEKMKKREEMFDDAVIKFNALPLKGGAYRSFNRESLNNAAVLSRAIYFVDLEMFENLYAALDNNLPACLKFFLTLEKKIKKGDVNDPQEYTKQYIVSLKKS